MPKSSRHKSSRHSLREAREYSDSERESGLKDRLGREDGGSGSSNRHLKDSMSGEKRKHESKSIDVSKELDGLGNVEYVHGYGGGSAVVSMSKKRKEKVEHDRWTGGEFKGEHELVKSEMKKGKEKEEGRGSGDARRSSRREESGFDVEEGKKSGSKVESKLHRSERKERGEKDGGLDRERKGGRSDRSEKTERLVDILSVSENAGSEGNKNPGGSGEERVGKHSAGNTDYNIQEGLQKLEPARDADRRVRRKRDSSGDVDRVGVRDPEDRRLSSRDEIAKYGKIKDDGQKDERNRGQFQEDIDKDSWHHNEKQLDNRPSRDHNGGKSDDKHLRNEKKDLDVSQKKSKPQSSEYDRELNRDNKGRDRDRDYDRDRGRGRVRDRSRHDYDRDREHDDRELALDRDRERDLEHANDRDREFDRDREHGRDCYRREHDRDRVNDRDNDGGRDRDFDRDHDYASHVDERGSRYKDDRGQRRSPDVYDGYHGDKVRRIDTEVDKDRSLLRKPNVDGLASSSRRRASPTSRDYVGAEKYRDGIRDETKYVDSVRDSTMSEAIDKVPKYRSGEKRSKFDENHIGELSERAPSTKASPAGLKERSPSSYCFDRSRFPGRSSRRRSLEVDEAERRSSGSNDLRDISAADDRQSREFFARKSMGDEYLSSDPSMYHKSGQGNVSSHGPGPGPSVFRSGADSPSFVGSFGEDSRGHSGNRYRRSVDPNVGRGPGNAWNGVPNWPSPLPNGFMPFPPGPPGPHHGGFPPILSQFPPLFGVRPSLDINHHGLPYHMADGDQFPGHVRPLGWPNMVDDSVPHFHVWEGGNGILREDPGMFGPGYLGNAQRRDMNADIWKQNDVNADVTSGSQKDGHPMKASADEASSAQVASRHNVESSGLNDQGTSLKKDTPSVVSPMKDSPMTPVKLTTEKTPESSNADDTAQSLRAYLAKLDISIDLADPELYNQFIDLAVKGQSESIEEELELDFTEEKAIVESAITSLTLDANLFPAAKDSIFQRAMDLYKAQGTERRSSGELDGDKLCTPPAQPEVEHTHLSDEKAESPVDFVKQEQRTPAGPEGEVAGKEPVCTGVEILNDGPLQSSELALDVGNESQIPVLDVEKMEEDASVELNSENADNGILPVESVIPDTTGSNADKDIVTDGDMICSCDSAPGELLDVAVSSPLILPHESVKVCEPLISVSDELESVILSRIHHAPESTH